MPNFKKLYEETWLIHFRRAESIPNYSYDAGAKGLTLTAGDKERARDFMEDAGMKIEDDFGDQFYSFFENILDELLTIITPIILGLITGGVGLVVSGAVGQLLNEEAKKKLQKAIKDFENRVNPEFSKLKLKQQFWVWDALVRGYIYRDIFVDSDYSDLKSGKLNPDSDKGKRIYSRVLFYKLTLCQMSYKWEGAYENIPPLQFSFNDTPLEIAQKYMLGLLRYQGESGQPNVNVTEKDFTRVYKVHEFFQKESQKAREKESGKPEKQNQAIAIGGLILGIISALGS